MTSDKKNFFLSGKKDDKGTEKIEKYFENVKNKKRN